MELVWLFWIRLFIGSWYSIAKSEYVIVWHGMLLCSVVFCSVLCSPQCDEVCPTTVLRYGTCYLSAGTYHGEFATLMFAMLDALYVPCGTDGDKSVSSSMS